MKLSLFLVLLLLAASAAQEVTPAPEIEGLFHRTQGWTGADGTYSYRVDPHTVLWTFSDTFWGNVVDGRRRDFEFLNNSQVLQTESGLTFLPSPAFSPPDRRGWFWMWDGYYEGDFHVILGHFAKDPEEKVFGFKQIGLYYARARLDRPGERLLVEEYRPLPFFLQGEGFRMTFGSCVLRKGPWIYILGTRDRGPERAAVLARTPRGAMGKPGTWRFYDGAGWGRDPLKAASLFPRAAMESSIYQTRDGGFLYLASVDGEGRIVSRYARDITGPWGEPSEIYRTPENDDKIYTYNGKAHPEVSREGKVLISYNVNTFDLDQVISDANIYRPRFIWWTPPSTNLLPIRSSGAR